MSASPRPLAQEVTDAFRVVIAGAVAMVVVLIAALTWFVGVSDPALDRSAQLVSLSQSAQSGMIEQASLLRAYVVTADSSVLATYPQLRDAVDRDQAALRTAAAGLRERRLVEAFIHTDQVWQRGWAAQALEPATRRSLLSARGDLDPTRLTAFIRGGHSSLTAAQDAAQTVTDAGRAAQDRARRRTVAAVAGTAALLLMIATSVAIVTVRRRQRLSAFIVGPVGVLLAKVQAVGRGEFGASPVIDAPLELLELRDELANMSASLTLQQQVLATRAEDAAASARRLTLAVDFAREISDSLTLTNVLGAVTSAGRRLLTSPRARVWLVDAESRSLILSHDSITGAAVAPATHLIGSSGIGRAAQHHQVFYSAGLSGDQSGGANDSLVVAVPLLKGARLMGVLEIVLPAGARRLDEHTAGVLDATARHAATAIDAALLYSLSESLSRSDPLTGLANRRQLDQELELEIERAGRYHRPMTFLMIDIDHFKAVNDTFGHGLGDAVLVEIAALLRDEMRAGDTAYRYGGEEFAVLARDTDAKGGLVIAERIRRNVERRYAAASSGDLAVTISVGVAELSTDTETAADVVGAADTALYAAKRAGRNQVTVAELEVPQPRTADTVCMLP